MEKPTLLVTVDVENWFNSRLFDPAKALWLRGVEGFTTPYEDVKVVLESLEKHGVRATFFVLGSLLEEYPSIPHIIDGRGHEVGMHAYTHSEFEEEEAFVKDVRRGLEVFRRVGISPKGYRHPYFMINRRKLEILSKSFVYDVSVVPSLHIPGHYGHFFENPRPRRRGGIVELPLSVAPYLRLPAATGWYYRNLGERYIRWIMASSLRRFGYAQICLHSWEFTEKVGVEGIPPHVFKNCGAQMDRLVGRLADLASQAGAETSTCLEYAQSIG